MAKGSSTTSETPVFIVNNTDMRFKREVINIAKHMGQPYSQVLRAVIKKWCDSHPADMKTPMTDV
jgi:hypothetical protein